MTAIRQRERPSSGQVAAWVLLLALAQLADLLTTQAAMERGAVEGNAVAAFLLSTGGPGLLGLAKYLLVVAMALAAWTATGRWEAAPDPRWAVAGALVWRGLQVCVVVVGLAAIHNLAVIRVLPGP